MTQGNAQGNAQGDSSTRRASDAAALIAAVTPLIEAVGATLVDRDGVVRVGDGNIPTAREVPLLWAGQVVAVAHVPGLEDALDGLIQDAEAQLGAPLAELDRTGKQWAVQFLDRRGAFQLRRSVDEVAERLGVSRFTVYNYLNRDRASAEADADAARRR